MNRPLIITPLLHERLRYNIALWKQELERMTVDELRDLEAKAPERHIVFRAKLAGRSNPLAALFYARLKG